MSPKNEAPFYVGYLSKAPAELSALFPKLLVGLGLLAIGLGLVLASRQAPAGPGTYELGEPRSFQGRIQEHPSPVLWVQHPDGSGAWERSYDLVAAGKHGVGRWFQGMDGRWVSLTGALISRPERALIEVVEGSVAAMVPGPELGLPARQELGRMKLVGEVVDSKCWAGVMKPGRGKPHRDCAVRCIAGGIPAVLVVVAEDGTTISFDLEDEEGWPMGEKLLDRVAEPLAVEGKVARRGHRLILTAAPEAFRRLSPVP